MNRISLIGMIFGLILISILCFFAGFLSSYLAHPFGSTATHDIATTTAVPASTPAAVASSPSPQTQQTQAESSIVAEAKAPLPAAQSTPSAYDIESEALKTGAQRVATTEDVGKFSVQLKTFSDRLWAVQTAKLLKKIGYGVYITQIPIKDASSGFSRSVYDVRLGVFDNYIQANQFARELRRMGHNTSSVIMIANNLNILKSDNE